MNRQPKVNLGFERAKPSGCLDREIGRDEYPSWFSGSFPFEISRFLSLPDSHQSNEYVKLS